MKPKHLALAAACLSLAPGLFAVPITVTGDFVRATFSDKGGLSNLFYDPTGTRNFGANAAGRSAALALALVAAVQSVSKGSASAEPFSVWLGNLPRSFTR